MELPGSSSSKVFMAYKCQLQPSRVYGHLQPFITLSYTSHINTLEIIHLRSELTTQESFSLTRDLLPLPLIRKRPGLLHRSAYSKDSLVPRLSPKASPCGGEPGNEATVNTMVTWLHQTNFKLKRTLPPSHRTVL